MGGNREPTELPLQKPWGGKHVIMFMGLGAYYSVNRFLCVSEEYAFRFIMQITTSKNVISFLEMHVFSPPAHAGIHYLDDTDKERMKGARA